MKRVCTRYLCLASVCLLQAGAAFAAPVTWATRPDSAAATTRIAPATGAEALDTLTAPLSEEQMGLSSGINFSTSFDEDLLELRRRFQQDTQEGPPSDDALAEPPHQDRLLTPGRAGPGLRLTPTLNGVPDF